MSRAQLTDEARNLPVGRSALYPERLRQQFQGVCRVQIFKRAGGCGAR